MIPARWYLPFFLPSTALMIGIAVALLVAIVATRIARRPGAAGTLGSAPWIRVRQLGIAVASMCAAILWIASMPLTAIWCIRATEAPYVPIDPASLPKADAIVVLSGAIMTTVGPDGYTHVRMGAAVDRHETALRAFFADRAPILALGNGKPAFDGAPTEAEHARDRAIDRGVPSDAIIVGPGANFTSDECSNIAPLLHDRGVKHIILCTSAHHMARAIPHYRAAGFTVTALPCHFLTRGKAERFRPMWLVPSAQALEAVDLAAKNWLGRLVGPRVDSDDD